METAKMEDEQIGRRRRFWFQAIWLSIVGVVVPPMFGLMGTVISMSNVYNKFLSGGANPERVANDISFALSTTAWGLVVSMIAFTVLIWSLIRFFTLPKVAVRRE